MVPWYAPLLGYKLKLKPYLHILGPHIEYHPFFSKLEKACLSARFDVLDLFQLVEHPQAWTVAFFSSKREFRNMVNSPAPTFRKLENHFSRDFSKFKSETSITKRTYSHWSTSQSTFPQTGCAIFLENSFQILLF